MHEADDKPYDQAHERKWDDLEDWVVNGPKQLFTVPEQDWDTFTSLLDMPMKLDKHLSDLLNSVPVWEVPEPDCGS